MEVLRYFLNFAEVINLSKHIEILLLSNDCVIVPGFGGFMAHHIDARKDLSDGSFLPPIRSIGFNPKLTLNDSLLAQSYVEAYDISYPDAVMRIEDEVRELRQRIAQDGSYEFSDIGTISLNADGNYEFAPCEAGIVSPKLYGLGSFRMKTLSEIRAGIQSALLEAQQGEHQQDEQQGVKVEVPFTVQTAATAKPQGEETEREHSARIIALWRNVAVACIALLIFMLIPSPLVNSSQMAGNQINTALLDRVLPKDITTGQDKVAAAVNSSEAKRVVAEREAKAKKIEEEKDDVAQASKNLKEGYSIVVASRVTQKNAEAYVNNLRSRGFSDAFVYRNGHVKVLFGHYPTRTAAANALNSLNDNKEFAGAWITTVEY